MVLLGGLSGVYGTLFREKTPIFGSPQYKKGPHRRFGGSKFVADFLFWNYGNKRSFSFFRIVSNIFIREMNERVHSFTNVRYN